MGKYCGNCGTRMEQSDQFCGNCGTKFQGQLSIQPAASQKTLTKAFIDKELHNQKHSFGEYLGQALLFGLMILVACLGSPLILICGIFWFLNVLRMIKHDAKRRKLKYYILDRPCIEKKFREGDESPDEWQLWFSNRTGELYVALSVPKDFHDATELGEEFYVVFLNQEKTPCLCYRKSEWNVSPDLMTGEAAV